MEDSGGCRKAVQKETSGKIANDLLTRLKMEKEAGIPGGIYHKVQIELTYNSNHMEGSRLTHDQTRYIFETNTIGIQDEVVNVDDIVETASHFRCIDQIIELANYPLSEAFIKQLHYILKSGTSDSRKRGLLLVNINVLKMRSEEAQPQSPPMYPEKCGIY